MLWTLFWKFLFCASLIFLQILIYFLILIQSSYNFFIYYFSINKSTAQLQFFLTLVNYILFISTPLFLSSHIHSLIVYIILSFFELFFIHSLPCFIHFNLCSFSLSIKPLFIFFYFIKWNVCAGLVISHCRTRKSSEFKEIDLWVRLRTLIYHTHPSLCFRMTVTAPCQWKIHSYLSRIWTHALPSNRRELLTTGSWEWCACVWILAIHILCYKN